MKKFFTPKNILFYFLSLIIFTFLGFLIAGLSGAGKGQGLAGGAIVLGYGVITGGIAFIAAIFAVHFVEEKWISLLNKIMGGILILFLAFTAYRILTIEKQAEPPEKPLREKTAPPAVPIGSCFYDRIIERQNNFS